MKKIATLSLFAAFSLLALSLQAQPINNECATATSLNDVTNWCSGSGAYTNVNATLSSNAGQPFCFPDMSSDVWFSFKAEATTVNITVVGNTAPPNPAGGSLDNPQFALYAGNCGNLTEVACASDGFGAGVIESLASGLTVGQTYFIRVDGRSGNQGTFRLCVNNFNDVPDASGDCPTGVILCDKSSFSVQDLSGTGNLQNEFNSNICVQQEFASAWYRWTCLDPGTLTFTITPNNPSDDIDFAVFELPGGIDDCANKVKIRCEAAGENVGSPFPDWEICTGPTGLSLAETDTDEQPGCAPGNNNYVSAVNMVAGRSYALLINNFSNTGNGFSIEFGGTGTFKGPEANFNFEPDSVCQGAEIVFDDASTAVEGIQKWEWNFGVGASPAAATGAGPHEVTYNSAGLKSVVLTITSEAGCAVTTIKQIQVLPLPEVDPTIIADYCGPQDQTGGITLEPLGTALPYLYNWEGSGTFSPNNSQDELAQDSYSVTVKDANGCTQAFNFVVPEGLSLAASVDPVTPPTCNGDSDASLSISIQISNPPVMFDFGMGLTSDNTLTGLPAGTYNVYAVDNAGCEGNFTITIEDPPVLFLGVEPLDISCFGLTDGSVTAIPVGGAGDYTFLWSNGQTVNPIENLTQGTYTVTVTDANGCTITSTADIIEPENISLSATASDVLCAGDSTGVIDVLASGGTAPFEYSLDGVTFHPSAKFQGLAAGNYVVVVRDSRGCTFSVAASIAEPDPIFVEAGSDQTIDLGYTADIHAIATPIFVPLTLTWSPADSSLTCFDCLDPTALPVQTTTYLLTAEDDKGCKAVDSLTIFVVKKYPIYIPNTFSPNADGVNDFFTVYGGIAAKRIITLKVFARWGSFVFDGKNLPLSDEPFGWDGTFKGKVMNPSVFAYFAEVEFIDGVVVLFEGDVTIVR